MLQFLQIHNTNCNNAPCFRTYLQEKNALKPIENGKLKMENYLEHGKHGRNEIRTLRCLGLSRKLFAKAHQAKASNDDDQKICSRKLITHLAVLELTIITNLRNL